MTQRGSQTQAKTPPGDASLGQLISEATHDMSELVRKEVQLAKVELREEATTAARAGAKVGAAGLAAYLALLLTAFALAWGLAEFIPAGFAFLIVAIVFAAVGAVLYSDGRKQLKKMRPLPETKQSLKEDAEWAKAQTK